MTAALVWLKEAAKHIDAPVLVQEMRVRQRGVKPFIAMFVYLAILSIIALAVLYFSLTGARPDEMSQTGQDMFGFLSLAQLVMIVLFVPAYSSGAVSSERERGTFDLLALTLVPSSSIVTQKLVAAIGQVLLLVVASAPIVSMVFLLGGVSPLEVAVVYALLIVTAVSLGALGMLCSCCVRSTRGATFLAYVIAVVWMAGVPIGGELFRNMAMRGFQRSIEMFPLWFALMFAFVGGVAAIVVYAPLALILSRKYTIWKTRAFRMAVFGGVYALLLLALTVPACTDATVDLCYHQDMFILDFLNPFAAMCAFFAQCWDSYSPGSSSLPYWMVGLTMAFSIGCTVIFRHISSARFAGMRRS